MTDAAIPEGTKPYHDDDKIHLFLAYFGIFSLIPFLMFKDKRSDPQKEYVYWHGRQGLALAIVAVVGWVGCFILSFIPFLGCLILPLFGILILVFMIMGWVKAFGGQKWEMPGVCKVAEMFK